jgi:hypothetical protein
VTASPQRACPPASDGRWRQLPLVDPSREYFHQTEGYFTPGGNQDYDSRPATARIRQCQGLVAVWALEDIAEGEGFGLVPCSHQSELPPPPQLVLDAGAVKQPAMAAGDLLLCSAAALHGLPPRGQQHTRAPLRQVTCSFISATAPPTGGSLALPLSRGISENTERPGWLDELSPTARAVVDPEVFRAPNSPACGSQRWPHLLAGWDSLRA